MTPGRYRRPAETRYGFAALDRGDDVRMRARMATAPLPENGLALRAAHAKAWATRRSKQSPERIKQLARAASAARWKRRRVA